MISQPTSTEKVGIQTANTLLTHVSKYDNFLNFTKSYMKFHSVQGVGGGQSLNTRPLLLAAKLQLTT